MADYDSTIDLMSTIENCLNIFAFETPKGSKLTTGHVKLFRKMEKKIRKFVNEYKIVNDKCSTAQDINGQIDVASSYLRQLRDLVVVDRKWTRAMIQIASEAFNSFEH